MSDPFTDFLEPFAAQLRASPHRLVVATSQAEKDQHGCPPLVTVVPSSLTFGGPETVGGPETASVEFDVQVWGETQADAWRLLRIVRAVARASAARVSLATGTIEPVPNMDEGAALTFGIVLQWPVEDPEIDEETDTAIATSGELTTEYIR